MKITRRQLRKLIIESVSSNDVEFEIVHEGLFTGGTFERYYVIVTYSPQMIAVNLGVTGDSSGLRLNDKIIKITRPSLLNPQTNQWYPIILQKSSWQINFIVYNKR